MGVKPSQLSMYPSPLAGRFFIISLPVGKFIGPLPVKHMLR
jgi:hypothetical protein